MRRLLALVVALALASCVRAVVLDPAPDPDAGLPDAQPIDDGGAPGDAAVPDVPQD